MSSRRPRALAVVLDGFVQVAAGCARIPPNTLLRRERDERLVELARAGDERAFEAIIERYAPALLAHCRRIAGETAAQDAVQQAFITAWSALRGGQDVRHLRA